MNKFFSLPIFTLFGLSIPWNEIGGILLPGIAAAVLIMIFRRLPHLLLLRKLIPELKNPPEALIAGWFGPIGVSSIFYSLHVYEELGDSWIWAMASLVILTSIIVHGLTQIFLIRVYEKRRNRK